VVATRSASFIQPFCRLGLVPDSGGTWLLPRLVGTARAMGLTMLGDKITAEQAAEWGLIWRCVDDADFASVVDTLAGQLAAAPTRGLAKTKQAIYDGWTRDFSAQLDIETDYQRELGWSEDYAEGVAAFAEKRVPRFSGR
jgi:2-(1,2-epoxy-1,2-dihydrophenyl)acetyl-CoA isomerase